MASKKPKGDLMAISKLEFYRKQKNWRHCPQERKGKDSKRRTKNTNAKLNQTYNIAPAPEKQEPSVSETQETEERHILDEAFVDTETGTESDEPVQREDQDLNLGTGADKSSLLDPPGSPYSPKWSIQRWAERRRLWNPEPAFTSDPLCPTHDPTCPTRDPTCPTLDPTFLQQANKEEANCPIFDNNYNKIQDVYYLSHYLNPHKGADCDANYPTQYDTKYEQEPFDPKFGVSVVYYNSNMCHQEFDVPQSGANVLDVGRVCEWQAEDWERCAGEGAVLSDPDWLEEVAAVGAGGEDAADGAWQIHDLSSSPSDSASLLSAASSEFLRGAALAPHSTQIDLLDGAEAAAARALAAAVAAHSAALRALLAEAQRREMSKETPPPLSDLYSYDEVPVRDPGPAGLPGPLFNDPIVAGSRVARVAPPPGSRVAPGPRGQAGEAEGGRGRGRLTVGIRMGRPYRL